MSYIIPKVLILFGAGASYGSGGMKTPPPLGNKTLFDDLTSKSKIWHTLLDDQECIAKFDQGFEYGMDYVLDKQFSGEFDDLYPLLKDMASILLNYHIQEPNDNLYWKLCQKYFKELITNKLQFATLNYDCLLEEAIFLTNPWATISYWGDGGGIRLLKPHGSCNFISPPNVSGGGKIIPRGPGALAGPLVAMMPSGVKERLSDCPAPPGMSIYNTTKSNAIKSEQIDIIRSEFQKSIRNAELIIVVGVYPKMEGDDHIWENIRNAKGMVGLVDRKEYCIPWREKYRIGRDDPILEERFITSYNGICNLIDRHI